MNQQNLIMLIIAGSAALCAGTLVWVLANRLFAAARPRGSAKPGKGAEEKTEDLALTALNNELRRGGDAHGKLQAIATYAGSLLNRTSVGRDLTAAYAVAGWPGGRTDNELCGLILYPALGIALLTAGAGLFVPPLLLLAPFFGFACAYLWLKTWIAGKRAEQAAAVSDTMPYAMDLICMTMQAGASFLMTVKMVAEDYAGTPIGTEFSLIINRVQQGMSASEAVQIFKERFPMLEIVGNFADDVINSARYGNPLAEVLANSSKRYKDIRIQSAREKAGKAKVKILVPGVIILFGSLLILFGPFVVKFLHGQNNMGI